MKITVGDKTFTEQESWILADIVMESVPSVEEPEQVSEYLKNHEVQEYHSGYVLRNPDYFGLSFHFLKEDQANIEE